MKIYENNAVHMTKMAAPSIYDEKTFQKSSSREPVN